LFLRFLNPGQSFSTAKTQLKAKKKMLDKNEAIPKSESRSQPIPYWRMILDRAVLQPQTLEHQYRGNGTKDDPYVVEWLPGDSRNPFNFSMAKKIFITIVMAMTSLSVSFSSSAYLSPAVLIAQDLRTTEEVCRSSSQFTQNR
jgi:hypothetical protein